LEEWVAPLARRGLEARISQLRFVARREYRVACDWKVFCDNYLDGGYHVNTIHPALASVIDYVNYRTQIDGHASFQTSPLSSGKDEQTSAVRRGEAVYAWVFPNLMVNVSDGVMDTNLVLSDGPGRCRVIFDFYFADVEGEKARQFIEESMAVSHKVQLEDGEICEDVQRGLVSRVYDVGRFSVRREGAGYHFHQLLARWLRGIEEMGHG
jgi:choline monooxygenase